MGGGGGVGASAGDTSVAGSSAGAGGALGGMAGTGGMGGAKGGSPSSGGSGGNGGTTIGGGSGTAGGGMGGVAAAGGSGGAGAGGKGGAGAGGLAGAGAGGLGGAGGSGGAACTVPATGGEDFQALLTGPQSAEAESAQLGGAAAVASAGSGWTGTGFADMKASEGSMTWLIIVPAAGDYTLDWRYTQDEARDMRLVVNCMQVAATLPFADTGSWNTMWANGGATVVALEEGTNQIKLETNGGSGPNFDALVVTPPLCNLDAVPTTCEAERALMSDATGLAAQGSGWTGEGYADMFGSEGAVNWVLDAPAAGSYALTFRYTQDATRDMSLVVNGVVVVPSLAFNDTNSWNANWAADITTNVTLNDGLNSVQLRTNGGSGPNFDNVSISPL
jgi:hypothetical protein